MTVCITGMSRSGTSMVTRLLNLCGMYLGDEVDLMPANAFNIDGYWENMKFVALNDAVLNELGGAWDWPPDSDAWDRIAQLTDLIALGRALLEELAVHEPAGWKDPRTSLTVPFWQTVMPNLKVIVCVRNPIEVASSLLGRQHFTLTLSLNLWATYNRRILATVPPERRLVTHYDRYFDDPEREIARLLQFAGMRASETAIARCRETVTASLRHHRFTMEHLRDLAVAPSVIALYEGLCAEAGWVNGEATEPAVATSAAMHALIATPLPSPPRSEDEQNVVGPAISPAVWGDVGRIGRLDHVAVSAIMLRSEVERLTAELISARSLISELQRDRETRTALEESPTK